MSSNAIQKDKHREDRLSFSNYAEHTLRKELNAIGTYVIPLPCLLYFMYELKGHKSLKS